MKVKVIHRTEEDCTKRRAGDPHRLFRNPDPLLHPLQQAREVKRAINAAKLDRIFAKPFLKALTHSDAVLCVETHSKRLDRLFAGCADGTLWQWDLANQKPLHSHHAHQNLVSALACTPDGRHILSCSTDCTIKLWKVDSDGTSHLGQEEEGNCCKEFPGNQAFRCLDHHWEKSHFLAGGSQACVELWDHHRSQPIQNFTWGSDSITSVRFSPVEQDLFGSTASDRSIVLYDLRSSSAVRKLILQTKSNALSWNPMEPMTFVVANEDCNLYTYDIRRLDAAQTVHKGFVSSVMDVDFSPTGHEFVAAGYDRTLRLFDSKASGSRDVYFTPRMARLAAVRFSRDGAFVFSASDDMNVRLWKANASEQLGVQLPQERKKKEYHQALIERYRNVEEVQKVRRSLHVPKPIYKAQKIRKIIKTNDERKIENLRKHSKPNTVPRKAERKKKIVTIME